MNEKSILEEALLQVENLEEALKQNAKGILSSVMKKELNDLLKESLEEEDDVEDDETKDIESVSEQPTPDEEEEDMSDVELPNSDDEEEGDDSENEDDLDNKDIDSLDSEEVTGDDEDMDLSDLSTDDESGMEDDVMDMTGASDEEVLKIFKAMKPEDGIVVKKDGNKIELETGDDEFIIKLDEEGDDYSMDTDSMDTDSMDTDSMDEENLYEIELDEEENEEEKEVEASESKEPVKKVEATEASRTFAAQVRKPADMGTKFKAGRFKMNEQVETLKKQNAEYKKALVLFKEKLNEVAIFNANLAYATRLFTEQSTTKKEKLNILKRFDTVSTLSESKNLYNTIKTELGTKKSISETVVDKITSTPSTSTSKEMLSESKVYEDENFKRVKELMRKIK
jgi:nucleoid-associated protein YgaU